MPYRKRRSPLRGIGVAVGAVLPDPAQRGLGPGLPVRPDRRREDAQALERHRRVHPECLAIDVERSIDADGVVSCLERLARERGAPAYVRFDHGPEFIAYAVADWWCACLERLAAERGAPAYVRFDHGPEFIAYAVADWCRFNGTGTVFIDPGSPWQNAWIESFNGRLRDEYLNGQHFDSLLEAQVLLEDWRIDYNMNRPHSAHGWLTPVEFVEAWLNQQQLHSHSEWINNRDPLTGTRSDTNSTSSVSYASPVFRVAADGQGDVITHDGTSLTQPTPNRAGQRDQRSVLPHGPPLRRSRLRGEVPHRLLTLVEGPSRSAVTAGNNKANPHVRGLGLGLLSGMGAFKIIQSEVDCACRCHCASDLIRSLERVAHQSTKMG